MNMRDFLTFLIQSKKLTETAVQKCLTDIRTQKTTLPKVLIHRGYFTPQTLKSAVEEFQQHSQQQLFSKTEKIQTMSETHIQDPLREGKFFGKYEILEPIAKGGMGIVYKVRHQDLLQIYALKVLLSGTFSNREDILRFRREAQTNAKLKHPYIVQVFDSGELEGQPYLCMEFVNGTTLNHFIQEKKLSLQKTLQLFQKILEALAYAHQLGVIHRDLKPANIFITENGDPKIGDFGLAKDLQRDTTSQKLTQSGTIFGTPVYMPPEQVQGDIHQIDTTSDIYSIGACLYEALTQHCPFESENIHELFYKIISEYPIPLTHWNRKIPKDVETLVLKSLQKEKKKRYLSATDFLKDIERFLSGKTILAQKPSWYEKNKKEIKKYVSIVGILVLLLATSSGLFFFLQWKTQQKQRKQQQEASQKQLNLHQEQLEAWLSKIQEGLPLEQREMFLIEIAKMQEKEIFERLVRLVEEGERYFSEKTLRDPRLEYYYEVLTLALGRLENADSVAPLFHALESMSKKLSLSGQEKKSEADIQYMITLVQALVYSKVSNLSKKVMDIRKQVGEGGTFWNKTHPLFLQLLQRDSLTLSEETASEYYKRGELKFYAKDFHGAIDDFSHAIALDPALFPAYQFRGNAKLELKDILGAIADYDIVLQQDTYSSVVYVSRGVAKEKLKDFQGALEDFSRAIQINPKFTQAFYNRGVIKIQIQDTQGAIQDFTETIRLNPQYADAYTNRAILLQQLGDRIGALKDYSESLRLNPQDSIYVNRGFFRENGGDVQGALEDYSTAIRINPQCMGAYYNRGVLKQRLNDLSGAFNDLTEVIRLNPQYEPAYSNRGYVKQLQGDVTGALNDYQEAIRLNSKFTDAYIGRGTMRTRLKNYSGALEDYTQAIQLSPQMALPYYNRGQVLLQFNKNKEAQNDFKIYLKLTQHATDSFTQTMRQQLFQQFPALQENK